MWILRVLSGPQAGQVFPLAQGSNVVGRSSSAQIRLVSGSISKEHLRIEVLEDKIIATDLGSRNGSFLNGVKIKSSRARNGDKILLHDIFVEITQMPDTWTQNWSTQIPSQGYAPATPTFQPQNTAQPHYDIPSPYGSAAPQAHPHAHSMQDPVHPEGNSHPEAKNLHGLQARIEDYLETVVLPGVYKLPELLEFRWVLSLIMAGFILIVTSLSTIPLLRILKESIEEESQQHALTIASNLAQINRPALIQGQDTAVSVAFALNRPGVKDALIISNIDGNIIAPSTKAGTYPDIPFIHEARKKGLQDIAQVDSNTVIAVVPIEFYNAETGAQAVTAYSVVVYDMSSLAMDDGKTLSLFVQTLFIALIVGSILFYFMYKMIEHPIRNLNLQLDEALREGRDDIKVTYLFAPLHTLASNINSAMSRALSGGGADEPQFIEHDRNQELAHIVDLVGFPALAILATDESIAAINPAFEERTSLNVNDLLHSSIDKISDQALKLSIKDLVQRSSLTPDQLLMNELEFSGENYHVAIQAVMGGKSIAYYIVVLLPIDPGGA